MTREATVERNTKETKIAIKLNLDGTGKSLSLIHISEPTRH